MSNSRAIQPDHCRSRVGQFGTLSTYSTYQRVTGLGAEILTPNANGDQLVVNTLGGDDQIRVLTAPVPSSPNDFALIAKSGTVVVGAGSGNDTILVDSIASATTVSGGAGDDTVKVASAGNDLSAITAALTIHGGGDIDQLLISDQNFNAYSAVYEITGNTVQRAQSFRRQKPPVLPTGLITYDGFALGVEIDGSNMGNKYLVSGSPSSSLDLFTGSGANSVNVLATSGSLGIGGQGGLDTVNIGSTLGTQQIGGPLLISNVGGYTAVNVDDSQDKAARTAIIYSTSLFNIPITVISGLTPGGDILLESRRLSALTIRAGTDTFSGGGNTFRIHDTPSSLAPGGLKTSVFTGARGDNVTIDGTTGALDLDVQAGTQARNTITIGSATVGLDAINGAISVTGNAGATNDLTIDDSGSTTGHEYVMDRNFVQRLDKARIGYQNVSNLDLRAGPATDHVVVQDTMSLIRAGIGGTTIDQSGGNDVIDVLRTTGRLSMFPGGQAVVNVGNTTNSLDNILGAISVVPAAGNAVTLNLNDQSATSPEQLDIGPAILGTSFQRSGAALISVLLNPLASFQWTSGSGGTLINEYVPAAQTTSFILGNDLLTIGTKAGTVSAFGPITVTGGVGPDAVILNDSGENRPQAYDVSAAFGHETFATRGTTLDLGPNIETFEVKGGAGGNIINVSGTLAGMSTIIHTGAGLNTATIGGPADSLDAIQGPLTLDGAGGNDSLTFNDQLTTTVENFTLAVDQLTRVAADGFTNDMAPISFAGGFQAITLNVGSGGSSATVTGSLAGSTVTVNGNAGGQTDFGVDVSANAIQGPVIFNGQIGVDFAQYFDIGNIAPHTYTLTSTSIGRDGQAAVFSNVGAILYAPTVGGNTFNVNSVALGGAYKIVAANGDHATVGSLAPDLGGTLANILDQVNVVSATPDDAVALVFDDSGNTDTTAKHIVFGKGFVADGNVSMLGLTPIAVSWRLSTLSSVTVLGGAANEIFSIQPSVAVTPLAIDGGGGTNTLDYSGYGGSCAHLRPR